MFFEGFTLDAFLLTETKQTMNLCYEKYDIQANIAGQYSIPIAAYKIFST